MRTLHNRIQIIWIAVHHVFRAIVPNGGPNLILELRCDGMFGCVHVRHLCVFQALGEFLPCLLLHLVGLSNVEIPDLTRRMLQDFEQVQDLFVLHPFVKVLREKLEQLNRSLGTTLINWLT